MYFIHAPTSLQRGSPNQYIIVTQLYIALMALSPRMDYLAIATTNPVLNALKDIFRVPHFPLILHSLLLYVNAQTLKGDPRDRWKEFGQ